VATIRWDFAVEMQDGTEHAIAADQRDLSRWEMEPFGTPFNEAQTKPVAFARYLAWSAMRRTKVFKGSWEAFQDECTEVRQDAAQAGDEVDPGKAAPPVAT
jgi:hypothetical protein